MKKLVRLLVVTVALVAFGMATLSVAQEFYVVKDSSGKVVVVDKKPSDEKSIVKGPFKTKDDADKAMKAAGTAKPPKLPTEGC